MQKFTFMDLFGGYRRNKTGIQNGFGENVHFAKEWDKFAKEDLRSQLRGNRSERYNQNRCKRTPVHDILTAGFPWQAFSIAGRRGGLLKIKGNSFLKPLVLIKESGPKVRFFSKTGKGARESGNGVRLLKRYFTYCGMN